MEKGTKVCGHGLVDLDKDIHSSINLFLNRSDSQSELFRVILQLRKLQETGKTSKAALKISVDNIFGASGFGNWRTLMHCNI